MFFQVTNLRFSGNEPPSFVLPPGLSSVLQLPGILSILATVNETYSFQLNATDPENDPFTFSLDGEIVNDPNAMLDMGTFACMPNCMT